MSGKARLMRIYMGESDRWQGEPLYEAIVKRLRMMDIAGATVYVGILGYGVKGHTHKSGILPFSRDLPVMISVVDSEEKLARVMDEIESMMQDATDCLFRRGCDSPGPQPACRGAVKCERLRRPSCCVFISEKAIDTRGSLCTKPSCIAARN